MMYVKITSEETNWRREVDIETRRGEAALMLAIPNWSWRIRVLKISFHRLVWSGFSHEGIEMHRESGSYVMKRERSGSWASVIFTSLHSRGGSFFWKGLWMCVFLFVWNLISNFVEQHRSSEGYRRSARLQTPCQLEPGAHKVQYFVHNSSPLPLNRMKSPLTHFLSYYDFYYYYIPIRAHVIPFISRLSRA